MCLWIRFGFCAVPMTNGYQVFLDLNVKKVLSRVAFKSLSLVCLRLLRKKILKLGI